VSISRLVADADIAALKALVEEHHDLTASPRAAEILGAWDRFQPLFWKVSPNVPVAKPVPEPSKEPEAPGEVINENVIASK
jgi:glutamate synthase domain-containing protein 3